MARKKYGPYPKDVTRVEFVKGQILMTETGYPAHHKIAQDAYGDSCRPAPEEGWFWIPATPKAAADIRRRGLKAIGTVTTTFIPRQQPVVLDPDSRPEDIPAIGTQEHVELMLEETRRARDVSGGR